MSDAPSDTIEQAGSTATELPAGTGVTDVLMEQVDTKVGAIELAQKNLAPFQAALIVAKKDLVKLEAAATAATDLDVKKVYGRALEVARQVIDEVKKGGENVVKKIKILQEELKALLAQLAEKDPENPLIKAF